MNILLDLNNFIITDNNNSLANYFSEINTKSI